jgi:hypothetical protein
VLVSSVVTFCKNTILPLKNQPRERSGLEIWEAQTVVFRKQDDERFGDASSCARIIVKTFWHPVVVIFYIGWIWMWLLWVLGTWVGQALIRDHSVATTSVVLEL